MEIKHNIYFDGAVQSLAHVKDGKTVMSTGMVSPGNWDFGTAKSKETILVTSGYLIINGQQVGAGDEVTIEEKGEIKIGAIARATYICFYDGQ